MTDQTLELSALAPKRREVPLKWDDNPDGILVELAVRDDFGIFEHTELDRERVRFVGLKMKKDPTPAERATAKALLNQLARKLIIGGPDEAIAALPEGTKEQVVELFFSESDSRLLSMLEKMEPETLAELSRLGNSALASSDSTEATPSNGDE